MNKVILKGRLTGNPEHKTTQSGRSVAYMCLAVDRPGVKRDSGQQTADFINLQAWEKNSEFAQRYLHKGSEVLVEGRLNVRSYDDQQGKKQTYTSVVVERFEFCGKATKPAGDGEAFDGEDGEDVPF